MISYSRLPGVFGGRRSMPGFQASASVVFGGGGGSEAYWESSSTGFAASGVEAAGFGASFASTRSRSCRPMLSLGLAGAGSFGGSLMVGTAATTDGGAAADGLAGVASAGV